MRGALVGLIVQLRLGPEYGPDDGMDDRMALIESFRKFTGEWPSTDSGSQTTNIKCWDILPEQWEETLRFAIAEVQAQGLAERVVIARIDYVDAGSDYEWGEQRIVWPPDRVGPFSQWPESPGF